MAALGRIAREPLVHFLLLGAVLFAADHMIGRWRRPAAAPDAPIVVTAALRAELADGWTRAQGSPPTPEELETLVAAWIDEEILYREGVARGLERATPRCAGASPRRWASSSRRRSSCPNPPKTSCAPGSSVTRTALARRRRCRSPTSS
jgi:hypothetical protein